MDYNNFSKSYIHFKNLVSLEARVKELEQVSNKLSEK